MTEATKPKPKPRAKPKKKDADAAPQVPDIRDRVLEFRRVASEELEDNARNWRTHPYAQRRALEEVLENIGIAGALTAYYSKRNGGKLTLIDGHERRTHQADWPTLILDVTDEEADMLLLTLDPIAGLANTDDTALRKLLDSTHAATPGIEDLLQTLRAHEPDVAADLTVDEDGNVEQGDDKVLPEMELQPFEHYDYVVLLCKNSHDWMTLQELLGIEPVQFTNSNGSRQFGRGRVVDASKAVELLRAKS
jgi:hypothetical protein